MKTEKPKMRIPTGNSFDPCTFGRRQVGYIDHAQFPHWILRELEENGLRDLIAIDQEIFQLVAS
jgi:hypothetical protein